MRRLAVLLMLPVLLASCGRDDVAETEGPDVRRIAASELPGFGDAAFLPAVRVFATGCSSLDEQPGPYAGAEDWRPLCEEAAQIGTEEGARRFFEERFDALLFGEEPGLVTGYYEPVFDARAREAAPFTAPVLARPDDLVSVDLGAFRADLAGERIAGRVTGGRLRPYEDRQAIEAAPPGNAEVLGYMRPDDLFFLQIQGSGVLNFPGGGRRIGYAAQNGHPYVAIGRTLVEEGHMALEDVTMQSIKAWLADADPAEAARVRATNPSYVFFTDRGPAGDDSGPAGTAGLPLTPMVSVAVDRTVTPMGGLVWIAGSDEVLAVTGPKVAQDTGGAIRGPARADLFLGRGEEAGDIAGRLKLEALVAVLVPKTAAMAAAPSA